MNNGEIMLMQQLAEDGRARMRKDYIFIMLVFLTLIFNLFMLDIIRNLTASGFLRQWVGICLNLASGVMFGCSVSYWITHNFILPHKCLKEWD